jgi:hypothetical protein
MGRKGMLVQILVLLVTFICYTLTMVLQTWIQKTQKIHGKKKYIETLFAKEL